MCPLPAKTQGLVDEVEQGNKEAAHELARIYRPDDTTDLVRFVHPDGAPPTWLFDNLADAFTAYRAATR